MKLFGRLVAWLIIIVVALVLAWVDCAQWIYRKVRGRR